MEELKSTLFSVILLFFGFISADAQTETNEFSRVSFDELLDIYESTPDQFVGFRYPDRDYDVMLGGIEKIIPIFSAESTSLRLSRYAGHKLPRANYRFRVEGEAMEVVLSRKRYFRIIVAHYADSKTVSRFLLPFGLTSNMPREEMFNKLQELNLIWDHLNEENQESLWADQGTSLRKCTDEDIVFARNIPVRMLSFESDSNGYSSLSFWTRSRIWVKLYYYREQYLGFIIGGSRPIYFPEMFSSDMKQVPGPLGVIRGKGLGKERGHRAKVSPVCRECENCK